jgi:uncharacterized delta-60 repeat protein
MHRTRPARALSERLEPRQLFSAGLVDTTFSGDGWLAADTGTVDEVALTPDGKTYVLGFSRTNNYGDVLRYNRDGSLDRTFSGDGKLTNAVPWADSMLLLRDGRLLVAGSEDVAHDGRSFVQMFKPDGSVDTSFGTGGKAFTGLQVGSVQDWVEQADGKILIIGQYRPNETTPSEMTLTRLLPDGGLDSTFGRGGVRTGVVRIGGYFSDPSKVRASGSLALYPDGRILVSASVESGLLAPPMPILYRLLPNGDPDFGTTGVASFYFDVSPGQDSIGRVWITRDNKILGAGTYNGAYGAVMRLTTPFPGYFGPQLDPTFDNDGVLPSPFGTQDDGGSLTLRSDGKFVVIGTGRTSRSAGVYYHAARYNADGTPDTTFGPNHDGLFAGDFGQTNPLLVAAGTNADGAIALGGLIYGEVDSVWTVAKLTGDADVPPPSPPPPPPLPRGAVGGTVFNDFDADGKWEPSEPPLPPGEPAMVGVRVYVDADKDGKLDTGETSVFTDPFGNYVLPGLPAGTWRVRPVIPTGFRATNPSKGYTDVTLTDGQQVGVKNFGLTQKTLISGAVYNDLNGNGSKNSGEPALSGWRVFLDGDNDGVYDSGEKSVLTSSSGSYTFNNLPAGKYTVRLVRPSGWRPTQPSSGTYTLTMSNGATATGKNLGVTRNVLISGTAFNDANGNAKRDTGETPLSGRRIFIDTDKDGVLDSGEKSVLTDSGGNWSFKDLPAGTYVVRIAPVSGWKSTVPTSGSYTFTLSAGKTATGKLFGQRRV